MAYPMGSGAIIFTGQYSRDYVAPLLNTLPDLKGRKHAVATTPTLAFFQTVNIEVPLTVSCDLVSTQADHECWIRIYGSAAERTRDASRAPDTKAPKGRGLYGQTHPYPPSDLITEWSSAPFFHNLDTPLAPTAYLAITNLEVGYTGPINLDIEYLPQEQVIPSGIKGDTGLSGRTLLVGTVAPTTANGQDGDSYIYKVYTGAVLTDILYYGQKTGGAWPAGFSLIGPGGTPGTPGNTLLSGTVDPTAGVGVDGNFYINKTAWTIFGPKAAGVWPAGVSLIGPPGPGMANPMTTAGDLIVGGAAGAPARLAKGADGQVLTLVAGAEAWATLAAGGGGSNSVASSTAAQTTITTSMPITTTPQSTDGTQILSTTITPLSATSRLRVQGFVPWSSTNLQTMGGAVFRDLNAAAVGGAMHSTAGGQTLHLVIDFTVPSNVIVATTFSLRVGSLNTQPFTINTYPGYNYWGGLLTAWLRVTEVP